MAGSGIRGQFEEKFKALLRDIEDEAGDATVGVRHLRERVRRTVRDECLGGGPVVTGQEDKLRGGTTKKLSKLKEIALC